MKFRVEDDKVRCRVRATVGWCLLYCLIAGPDSVARDPSIVRAEPGIKVSGELRQWHTVTLNLPGPVAREKDNRPNPFRDCRILAEFQHESGTRYRVVGYFAADGNAANTGADSGNIWRIHFVPDKTGRWTFQVTFAVGANAAIDLDAPAKPVEFDFPTNGQFTVAESNKTGRDLRGQGMLRYVGKRYLQFAGSGRYFLKAGADAPETLLAYADFDGTVARKKRVPLKHFRPHLKDWKPGDPTWKNGKGKGLIGAINYLSAKGCNAFSFLPYNHGGDGDNVWPHVSPEDRQHFDVSKLDQWKIVLDHGTRRGMYLHFKLQETENDDGRKRGGHGLPDASLDGGKLGVQRKLYLKELIARFGHNLALNWNLGEENTQSTEEQIAMAQYIADLDPYDHLIVVHTFPNEQDKVYTPLLGGKSPLRGASLQNGHIKDTHWQTVKWVEKSTATGVPWVVAFDESGTAAHGQCPDLGYRGFDGHDSDGKKIYTQHEVRRMTLWGTLMGGGAGVEYYFGYKFAENDLLCEDWRSRDQSWDYCRIALDFFHQHGIPFWKMTPHDDLVGNPKHSNSVYCLADPGTIYLVYVPDDRRKYRLDLQKFGGQYNGYWFNPRTGKSLASEKFDLPDGQFELTPPGASGEDWLLVLKKDEP